MKPVFKTPKRKKCISVKCNAKTKMRLCQKGYIHTESDKLFIYKTRCMSTENRIDIFYQQQNPTKRSLSLSLSPFFSIHMMIYTRRLEESNFDEKIDPTLSSHIIAYTSGRNAIPRKKNK